MIGTENIRLHPNGFIQVDLGSTGLRRLHVWPYNPIPAQQSEHHIHDHTFDFVSHVICGRILNHTYTASAFHENAAYMLHSVTSLGNNETVLAPINIPVDLYLDAQLRVNSGERYRMLAGVFHETFAVRPAATIMEKLATRQLDGPYGRGPFVAVPIGVTPDNSFSRNSIDPEFLWRNVEEVLSRVNINNLRYSSILNM